MNIFKSILVLVAVVGFLGCDDEGDLSAPSDQCASGVKWVGGNEESPLMRPGGDCIGCHAALGEGPTYIVAGTIHPNINDPADCYGVEGATVTITDANNQSVELTTNKAGNFFLKASKANLTMPLRATVSIDGRTATMNTMIQTGDCATCHTTTGANGTSGRIIVP